MKKLYAFLSIFFGITIMFGCEEDSRKNEMVMEGVVAKIDVREIFIYEESEGEAAILSEEEVISKSIPASYFGFDEEFSGVEVGDKVKVWYDAMDTSLPGSGHGTKIEVIDK